jgi:hypothetical protein
MFVNAEPEPVPGVSLRGLFFKLPASPPIDFRMVVLGFAGVGVDTLPLASAYSFLTCCSSGHHLSCKAAFPSTLALLGTLLGTAKPLLVAGRNLLVAEGIRLLETTEWT